LAGLGAFSAAWALWMAGFTVLKENSRLDLYPPFLFAFVIRWYYPLLWAGLIPGLLANGDAMILGLRGKASPWLAAGLPLLLGALWIWVGWLLIGDNVHQIETGYPFHWPH
ncbi:MAG TPA: hypothetical protein VIM58_09795, partial [Candidatus Methylacidiphilales bacterium]